LTQRANSQTERTLTHIYVRDAQKGFVRPCWAADTEVYCGMCMCGAIQPVVGAVCPICSSTVERILELAPGGASEPARKGKDCSNHVELQDLESVPAALECPASIKSASVIAQDGTRQE
jgi:hypothetical protein